MANRLNCAMGDMLPDHHCLTYYPYNPLILPAVPPKFLAYIYKYIHPIQWIVYDDMNIRIQTNLRTLAPVEDKPGGLMAALSPYEIPPKTPGELHWIYSLWVSNGGHLIFFWDGIS